ncbi:MAG: hypothetical protein K0R39_1138 [Symbiobacteriaceae bacterium]|jgi:hypothetical protein|nr:hypothetical protein [Symbiobacteriaceae bacterium]
MASEDPTNNKPPAPKPKSKAEEEARAALAKFREQADHATHDLFLNARRDQLQRPDLTSEILKGTTIPASVWTYGPGRHNFTVQFDERLVAIAKFMKVKLTNKKVVKLQAYFLGESGLLVMYPAPATDNTAFEIKRYKNGTISVNLSDLLIAQGYAVEANYRELRRVVMAPEESELWPALTVNYEGKPEERKFVPRSAGEDAEGEENGK